MKTKLRILPLLLVGVIFAVRPHLAISQNENQILVMTHANVIDGRSNEPLRDATIVIRNGKIEEIGRVNAPAGATVLDLKGRWLLPGFVDAHAHIANLAAARIALQSGVTTARDLGVNHYFDIGVRELNHAGS